jgi:hypothetical protein
MKCVVSDPIPESLKSEADKVNGFGYCCGHAFYFGRFLDLKYSNPSHDSDMRSISEESDKSGPKK